MTHHRIPRRLLALLCHLASVLCHLRPAAAGVSTPLPTDAINGVLIPGVRADGATDDRAILQAALDAAEANGGGTVKLPRGVIRIVTVNSPASGDKAAGAYGLEIPTGVTLAGSGDGTIIEVHAGGAFGVGVGISPKGMRTATTDFGAASGVVLRDFTIRASAQAESSGNLINLVHASDWLISHVTFAGSLYHGLEIDQSRRISVQNCTWTGSYSGASGSWIQFDLGLAGPTNRPATITTTLNQDVTFSGCVFKQRPDTDTSGEDIALCHSGTQTNDNITFADCVMEGRSGPDFVSVIRIDSVAAVSNSLRFERCRITTAGAKTYGFYFANATATVRRMVFDACDFRGPSAFMFVAGGSTSSTYNATQSQRQFIGVTNCSFWFDKAGLPLSYDINYFNVIGWLNAEVSGNFFRGYNDFIGSVGMSYCTWAKGINNLATTWKDNRFIWEGNNTFAVQRTAVLISSVEADNAGTGMGAVVTGNTLYSTAGTGWSYGLIVSGGSSAVAARKGCVFEGNFGNVANSGDNNTYIAGLTAAGAPTTGAQAYAVRTITSSGSATQQDGIIHANTASASITITSPAVIHRHSYIVKKTSASNTLTIGSTSVTALDSVLLVYCDGVTTYVTQLK